MIITKTPFRISFLGGGSDLEDFYSRSPGAVLSVSINKFMYICSHRFFEEQEIRIKYSRNETVQDVLKIEHPIVREVLRQFKVAGALEITSNADIPAGTGLGSSSAYTVGLLHNMHVRFNNYVTKGKLAEEACEIEIGKLKEPIGKQDQYASAFGGLNVFNFNSNGEVGVDPIHLKKETYKTLQKNLLLFYTGRSRAAGSVLKEQKANMQNDAKFNALQDMVGLVEEGKAALFQNRLSDFGKLLHESWVLKRQLASAVSDPVIDEMYEQAIQSGALGGKILGAGGGGFLLFYCDEENQPKLRRALQGLRELPFRFENEGSKLIYIGDEYEK